MRFAISIPQFADGDFDPPRFRDYMRRAEAIGFEGAWAGEQVLGSAPMLGPIELLTYAAACSDRIRLGVAMLVLPLYSPLHLAKSLASLDQLSRGRLDVGLGVGGRSRMFSAFGVESSTLVGRFNESLDLIERLWTEEKVDFDGTFWQLKGAQLEPKPFQKPRPPIWFGGAAPAALRRAVRRGHAFMGAGSQTTEQFASQAKVVKQAMRELGRTDFVIAKRVYIRVDDDEERARARMDEGMERMYGYFGIQVASAAVSGSPETCRRKLAEVRDAGAEMILLNPIFDEREQMERLAAEIVTVGW
jgi:alkanesulfonate monooxygenase SsuD/methylene tetrahydromethanopterin reductase-like flavin-dependent oxidoreductase (luciferase family)